MTGVISALFYPVLALFSGQRICSAFIKISVTTEIILEVSFGFKCVPPQSCTSSRSLERWIWYSETRKPSYNIYRNIKMWRNICRNTHISVSFLLKQFFSYFVLCVRMLLFSQWEDQFCEPVELLPCYTTSIYEKLIIIPGFINHLFWCDRWLLNSKKRQVGRTLFNKKIQRPGLCCNADAFLFSPFNSLPFTLPRCQPKCSHSWKLRLIYHLFHLHEMLT